MIIDLPAPVSPVKTTSPRPWLDRSRLRESIRAMFSMRSSSSIVFFFIRVHDHKAGFAPQDNTLDDDNANLYLFADPSTLL